MLQAENIGTSFRDSGQQLVLKFENLRTALNLPIARMLFVNGRMKMHRDAMTVGIQTAGGWVAVARHTTDMRKQRIPKSVAVPAASPTWLKMRIMLQASRTC